MAIKYFHTKTYTFVSSLFWHGKTREHQTANICVHNGVIILIFTYLAITMCYPGSSHTSLCIIPLHSMVTSRVDTGNADLWVSCSCLSWSEAGCCQRTLVVCCLALYNSDDEPHKHSTLTLVGCLSVVNCVTITQTSYLGLCYLPIGAGLRFRDSLGTVNINLQSFYFSLTEHKSKVAWPILCQRKNRKFY